jgi:hypothetical protein
MAADLKPDQKLTDEEVLAQITTFVSGSSCGLVELSSSLIIHARLGLLAVDM